MQFESPSLTQRVAQIFLARRFIDRAENELQQSAIRGRFIAWDYESNITDHNQKKMLDDQVGKILLSLWVETRLHFNITFLFQRISDALGLRLGREAKQFNASMLNNRDLRRKMKWIAEIGVSALPPEKLEEYNYITTQMGKIYSTAKVPDYKDKSKLFSLEPELEEVLAESRDPRELEYYWTEWRNATGRKMRDLYLRYVELSNEAARYE